MFARPLHPLAVALRGAAPLVLLSAVLAATAAGQEREVVSKQIAVGRDEASLHLEFTTGDPLDVSFVAGEVRVDGRSLGASTPELDAAWRDLLSRLVPLEGALLLQALREWSPGQGPGGAAPEVVTGLEGSIAAALAAGSTPPAGLSGAGGGSGALAALLARPGRLIDLAGVLEGARMGTVRLHVGEDVRVVEGEVVEATVVVVDGSLTVGGTVEGDVVVAGGTARLLPGGRVAGDVRLADSRLFRDGGELTGSVVEAAAAAPAAPEARVGADELAELRERLREEIRREVQGNVRVRTPASRGLFAPFRAVASGVGGVLSNLLSVLVLTLVGAAVLHFGGNNLEVVADTARRAPARAAAVGVAGAFLALPVWVLGIVVLAVSIIGIPLMLVWLPLFPLALALAAALGFYAVARNVGAWVARQNFPWFEWVRPSNNLTLVAAGLLGLMAAFIAANLVSIAGLSFLKGLFVAVGMCFIVLAALMGLGAVLITQGGRRPAYHPGGGFDFDWNDEPPPPPPPGAAPGPPPPQAARPGEAPKPAEPATGTAGESPPKARRAPSSGARAAGAQEPREGERTRASEDPRPERGQPPPPDAGDEAGGAGGTEER